MFFKKGVRGAPRGIPPGWSSSLGSCVGRGSCVKAGGLQSGPRISELAGEARNQGRGGHLGTLWGQWDRKTACHLVLAPSSFPVYGLTRVFPGSSPHPKRIGSVPRPACSFTLFPALRNRRWGLTKIKWHCFQSSVWLSYTRARGFFEGATAHFPIKQNYPAGLKPK